MIKRFITYYKPHMRLFVADMAAAFLLSLCDLFFPMITRNMISDYIPNQKLRLLIMWAVFLVVLNVVKLGLNYFIQYFGHIVGVRMQGAMRKDVFDHLQVLPFSYFDNNKTGTIMSRITNDLMDVTELAHHGPEDLFLSLVLLIGSFIFMASINIYLTLILFLALPFMVLFAIMKRKKMSAAFKQTRVEIGEINANLENSISGIRVSKAYTNRDYESEHFSVQNGRFIKARDYAYRCMAEFFSGLTFMGDVLNVLLYLAGGLFLYYGKINFADFTAFVLYVSVFMKPIQRLVSFIEQYQNGMSGFARFVEIMEEKPEEDAPGAVALENVAGEIEFDHVSFAYEEDLPILSEISFRVDAGKTLALVGPSGGGKTTICHLIPRFYEASGGTIRLDGHDIRDLTLRSLREHIGMVAQDVFLFNATIYDNIAYGCPEATREQVYEAARRANIHDYILGLPDGYETVVGERGIKLSGGQKQRVSIARVFLKNPPLLILDEATSALDNATEQLIQASLEELCRGRTTIVVAHRLSTIKNADEILVLTESGVAERGTHEELLALDGIYNGLYNYQFKHQ